MSTYGAVIIGRNDNYGNLLNERATYCLNSMIPILDEVIFVDWNTEKGKPSLIDEIKDDLIKSPKFKWVVVTPEQANEWTWNDLEAQAVCETQARNIGLRRLSTDFLISTNIDMICPPRNYLETITDETTFYTTGMRAISLYVIREFGPRTRPDLYTAPLPSLEGQYPQQPTASVHFADRYSLVSNCGDFQIAHRDIWYKMKGFEERFTGRAFMDSNVQKKAAMVGYNIAIAWNIPVWHIGHDAGYGGIGKINNIDDAFLMTEITNPETWGHSNVELEIHTL